MKVCVINFSGRTGGNCYNIARIVGQALSTDNEVIVKDLSGLTVSPCGKCGYGCFAVHTDCLYFDDDVYGLYDAICASDMTFYIVPNYCDYPNANFFMFNERSQCYFQNRDDLLNRYLSVKKKFIVVSNTEETNFIRAFSYHVAENTAVDALFLSARAFGKSSIKGDLMDSEQARRMVEDFVKQ